MAPTLWPASAPSPYALPPTCVCRPLGEGGVDRRRRLHSGGWLHGPGRQTKRAARAPGGSRARSVRRSSATNRRWAGTESAHRPLFNPSQPAHDRGHLETRPSTDSRRRLGTANKIMCRKDPAHEGNARNLRPSTPCPRIRETMTRRNPVSPFAIWAKHVMPTNNRRKTTTNVNCRASTHAHCRNQVAPVHGDDPMPTWPPDHHEALPAVRVLHTMASWSSLSPHRIMPC